LSHTFCMIMKVDNYGHSQGGAAICYVSKNTTSVKCACFRQIRLKTLAWFTDNAIVSKVLVFIPERVAFPKKIQKTHV